MGTAAREAGLGLRPDRPQLEPGLRLRVRPQFDLELHLYRTHREYHPRIRADLSRRRQQFVAYRSHRIHQRNIHRTHPYVPAPDACSR
ncbi:hypothetical protein GCM10010425_74220 [Streptomyces spororaveus]|uniref:Uncharacterized protein n=1 Tax=Streptomyces spororaveus TaxID=284039 RepID=A0ABQ3T224_9ACTN|nr:hypothetical protein Sspor_00090 [Streptomyces spororaveus]GHI82635.1 hypothetical protein Sspor_81960 [Streptomyces spororaveus]